MQSFLCAWSKCGKDSGWVSGVATTTKNNGDVPQRLLSEKEYEKYNQIVEATLVKKIHFELHDFDLWLDNPAENDFTNFHIENLLTMFTNELD